VSPSRRNAACTVGSASSSPQRHRDQHWQELPGGECVVRGMWLRSQRLKLVGKADTVEFRPVESGHEQPKTEYRKTDSVLHSSLPVPHIPVGHATLLVPFPVEYKRGRRTANLIEPRHSQQPHRITRPNRRS
jgi:hypothetical protein